MTILQIILTAFIFKLGSANADQSPDLDHIPLTCDAGVSEAAVYFSNVTDFENWYDLTENVIAADQAHIYGWDMICDQRIRQVCNKAANMMIDEMNVPAYNWYADPFTDPELMQAMDNLKRTRTNIRNASRRYIDQCHKKLLEK